MAASAAAATAVRILIVEDDQDASDALAYALLIRGFTVECAATVGQSLLLLERGLIPDAVVLDLRLPDGSGGLLLRRIKRTDLPTKVALVTGLPNPQDDLNVRHFAPDAVFGKPLDYQALIDWLQSIG